MLVKTYRHIVIEFGSENATDKEINEIANSKANDVIEQIGNGVTGQNKGKEVYWSVKRG